MKFLLCVIGVVLVFEGVPWFLSPQGLKKVLRQLISLPDGSLRMMGFCLMMTGLLLVYLAVGQVPVR